MATLMSYRLRSLTLGMNYPIKVSNWFGEIAEKELNKLGLPYETWDRDLLIKYRPEMNILETKMAG